MMILGRWISAGFSLSVAMLLGANSVAAQKTDWGLRPDSAGVPADTVRLPTHLVDLGRCDVLGYRVVTDSVVVKRLWQYPQCKLTDFGDVYGRTLVGIPLWGDCHARFRIDAWRSEQRREYRVLVTDYYGGCRAMRGGYHWMVLPKLPPGWRVAFGERRVDGGRETRDDEDRPFLSRVWLPQPATGRRP